MKKSPALSQAAATPPGELLGRVVAILDDARHQVVRSVNSQMVLAYWLIGREIVQALQGGDDRAGYGEGLLDGLSRDLSARFGRGFSLTNLKNCRLFYQAYPDRRPQIRQMASDQSGSAANRQTASDQSEGDGFLAELSWSHYVFLMGVRSGWCWSD